MTQSRDNNANNAQANPPAQRIDFDNAGLRRDPASQQPPYTLRFPFFDTATQNNSRYSDTVNDSDIHEPGNIFMFGLASILGQDDDDFINSSDDELNNNDNYSYTPR
jgi:hypothetical protein